MIKEKITSESAINVCRMGRGMTLKEKMRKEQKSSSRCRLNLKRERRLN